MHDFSVSRRMELSECYVIDFCILICSHFTIQTSVIFAYRIRRMASSRMAFGLAVLVLILCILTVLNYTLCLSHYQVSTLFTEKNGTEHSVRTS